MNQIIARKRDRHSLSTDEINHFIQAYTAGDIPDYQASALLMAIYLNGMDRRETVDLTLAMARSGDQLDLHDTLDFVIDKHSSGGVGDKTTLVVLPLVAACGVPIAKMSGRGLGFTGGTLDKMESIPGWRCDLELGQFKKQVSEIGLALAGQTAKLAPADGKLYALRDVTSTVGSLPLIASSIMSKKLAAGADGIVLDVKIGSGAFVKDLETGKTLAQTMVNIGNDAGREVLALLSDMNQPLGHAVGNRLEVIEAVQTLQNHPDTPSDFWEHCLDISKLMLKLARPEIENLEETLVSARDSGAAFKKFEEMVVAQGGEARSLSRIDQFEIAPIVKPVMAPTSGHIISTDTEALGWLIVNLGGGRLKKGDPVDHSVGFKFNYKVGDAIEAGDPMVTLHAASETAWEKGKEALLKSIRVGPEPVDPIPHAYGVIS
ncbi:MAG: thymidine phosphorylase [Chloroflexota bacterium]